MIARAAENFLNWNTTDISNSVQDVLEGNLQEVIGQMGSVRWSMTVKSLPQKCRTT